MGNLVVSIGRQYGSGGREIGFKLAEKLGVTCYDKELLSIAAKESGLCEEIFELHDEKPTHSFLYNLVMDVNTMGYNTSGFVDMPINHKVFLAQFDSIKKLAEQESCVIVGRCADYALDNNDNLLSIFIHSNIETRVNRIANKHNLTKEKAKDAIHKTDKKRASYYNYYTSKKWGEAKGYKLSIDSGMLGIDGTVDAIQQIIDVFIKSPNV